MQNQTVALVTGANQGIGFQIAKELAAQGFAVFVGSRNLERGEAAAKSIGEGAYALQLDVTDQGSITAAAAHIKNKFGRLDVLVNNAAISHTIDPSRSLEELIESGRMVVASLDDIRTVFETNVFGVIAVTKAMLPLLLESTEGRIVNVSSGAGSLTSHSNPDNPMRAMFGTYSSSKTALNAITLAFAIELEPKNIKVNAVCPGFTATALNNFAGTQTLEEAAREPVRLALLGAKGPTGTFSNASGPVPW